jgi:hypothetical protein
MKVTENTPDRLILNVTGWGNLIIGLVVLAVLFVQWQFFPPFGMAGTLMRWLIPLIVLAIVLPAIERAQFWADRTSGTFAVRRKTIFRRAEVTRPLADLVQATMASRRGSKGGRRYRAELMLTDGSSLPLTGTFAGFQGAERAVKAVNGWLGNARLD